MPIFEYRCRACGKVVEKFQKESSPEITCPVCGNIAERSVSIFSKTGSGGCGAPSGSGFS